MASTIGAYATLADVKVRLGITSSDTAADVQLQSMCNQANQFIETRTGRVFVAIGSNAPVVRTFDGFDLSQGGASTEFGKVLIVDTGIVSLTTVEVATYTGDIYMTTPTSDWFLRPSAQLIQPGWPYTELVMTNVPTVGNARPAFYPGYDTVRLTGVFGWPATPDDITEVAQNITVQLWRAKGAGGGGETTTIGMDGERIITRLLSSQDWDILWRYTRRDVYIV